jgi:hypothetical protein
LLYPKERAPRYHSIGGWVHPRYSLDILEKRNSLAPKVMKESLIVKQPHCDFAVFVVSKNNR